MVPALISTNALCRDWRVYQPRKGDRLSPKSAAEILASNEARVVYGCAKRKNEAA